jgi:molybdopterin-guanine dinucleotide biosynthesis protein A/molybdopterin converting factor small subunit
MSTPLLCGLVLAGGRSRRMAADKALIDYGDGPQLDRAVRLLALQGVPAFVSVRADQVDEPARARHPQVVDQLQDAGPSAGILAALARDSSAAWLVLACDLPFLDASILRTLIAGRDPARVATAFRSAHDALPEPLCAIFEPAAREPLAAAVRAGQTCPRAFLRRSAVALLDLPRPEALDNVNTPDERRAAAAALDPTALRALRVQYFALLREQAGRAEETVESRAATPRELLAELRQRHRFTLPENVLKVAINGEFAPWEQPLRAGDAIVFIPPVAGG